MIVLNVEELESWKFTLEAWERTHLTWQPSDISGIKPPVLVAENATFLRDFFFLIAAPLP